MNVKWALFRAKGTVVCVLFILFKTQYLRGSVFKFLSNPYLHKYNRIMVTAHNKACPDIPVECINKDYDSIDEVLS